jgi:hypothetical protein
LLVGIAGFFAPHLLGMHLTTWHNVIHLATGAAALYFGYSGSLSGARRFAFVFGMVYFGLGVLGFVAPGLTATLLGHEPVGRGELAPDNAVHLVIGGAFMLASRARARATDPTPARADQTR